MYLDGGMLYRNDRLGFVGGLRKMYAVVYFLSNKKLNLALDSKQNVQDCLITVAHGCR